MAIIKAGKYRFNDVLTPPVSLDDEVNAWDVSYLLGSNTEYVCTSMSFEGSDGVVVFFAYNHREDGAFASYDYRTNTWGDTSWIGNGVDYQRITILEDYEATDTFATWFAANTVWLDAPFQINITEPRTTTLATAGKYCDRNIAVNVAIPTYGGELVEALYISLTGTVGGEIPQGTVTVQYQIFDDEDTSVGENYKERNVFIEYGYEANNEGVVVPVLYHTNIEEYPDEIALNEKFFYEGTYEYDGVLYDKWQKIENNSSDGSGDWLWDSDVKRWYLTNRVVDRVVPYPKTITFTIGSTSYTAEVGMTWEQWCASSYNTDGYYINGTSVYLLTDYGTSVVGSATSTDVIVDGKTYSAQHTGGI